jgi:hypothetical protein
MSVITEIRAALSGFAEAHPSGDRHLVTTQYLYPSGDLVSVFVTPGTSGTVVVTDGGGAVDVLSSHGVVIKEPEKAFSPLRRYPGLKIENGEIRTGKILRGSDQLASAVIEVARASAFVADHCLNEFRPRRKRNLEAEIFNELQRHVSVARIQRNHRLVGKSNRQYTFDFAVPLGKRGTLIVDAVEPESASLLAKFASHMDISRAGNHVQQRIVYDDQEEWRAEDLNLLQMAATLVPLSKFRREVREIAG